MMQTGWKIKEIKEPKIHEDDIKIITRSHYIIKHLRNLGPTERQLLKEFAESKYTSFEEFLTSKHLILKKEHIEELMRYYDMETQGYSFVDILMNDKDIEEIAILGNGSVYVYVKKIGWLKTNVEITDEDFVYKLANRMAKDIDRRLTLKHPRVNANIPLGRIHACIKPISSTNTITIRKFREEPFTPQELVEVGTTNWKTLAFLWMCMLCDMNIVIAGNTGSGKTTTLNVLASFIPERERILAIEETPEINIPHEHFIRLIPNQEIGITFPDLVKDTLRMRPDRVIISEIRTPEETSAFIETILCGQGKGSYTTYHAQSPQEFISRMKFQGTNEQDLSAIDLLIIQRRWSTKSGEVRKITGLYSIKERTAISGRIPKSIKEKLAAYFGNVISAEIKKRSEFLKKLRNSDFKTTIKEIWKYDGENAD